MTIDCDYLIIGGGSSGAVVARRLADRTSGRIILLEAGKTDEGDPAAVDLKRLDEQTPDYDWGFRDEPNAHPKHPPRLSQDRGRSGRFDLGTRVDCGGGCGGRGG